MKICRTIQEMREVLGPVRSAGKRVGFVPTLGALHEGHFSLLQAAGDRTDFVVVSIFLNPTQFGPGEDLDAYPRKDEQDLEACRRRGVGAVFLPSTQEMYPRPPATVVEVPALARNLCGAGRPGHFAGVCLVVCKLLNIVQPDEAFFGRKDFQQLTIIRRMCEDLNLPVQIRPCPTLREPDGLALSSRNAYLTPEQRKEAPGLYRALRETADRARESRTSVDQIQADLTGRIHRYAPDGQIEYAAVMDPQTLEVASDADGPLLLALAVRLGKARLIDNLLVD